MDIQVSNLNISLIEADVQRLFTPFGEVSSLEILRDKLNNRSKGRAVIKMPVANEALRAINSLDGFVIGGKAIRVNEVSGTDENRYRGSMILR